MKSSEEIKRRLCVLRERFKKLNTEIEAHRKLHEKSDKKHHTMSAIHRALVIDQHGVVIAIKELMSVLGYEKFTGEELEQIIGYDNYKKEKTGDIN